MLSFAAAFALLPTFALGAAPPPPGSDSSSSPAQPEQATIVEDMPDPHAPEWDPQPDTSPLVPNEFVPVEEVQRPSE